MKVHHNLALCIFFQELITNGLRQILRNTRRLLHNFILMLQIDIQRKNMPTEQRLVVIRL